MIKTLNKISRYTLIGFAVLAGVALLGTILHAMLTNMPEILGMGGTIALAVATLVFIASAVTFVITYEEN